MTPYLLRHASSEASDEAGTVSDTNNLARLAKLPRFYRLIRVVRLLRLFKASRNLAYIFHVLNIQKGMGKLITVLVAVVFIIHLIACCWYWTNYNTGFEPSGWVVRQGLLDGSVLH